MFPASITIESLLYMLNMTRLDMNYGLTTDGTTWPNSTKSWTLFGIYIMRIPSQKAQLSFPYMVIEYNMI